VLTLPASVRIYVAAEAVDLRRGFDGLAAATRGVIGADPLSGHRASAYALNHWEALTRFVEDGRVGLHNNIAEQQLRSIALGRRNYLFAGSHDAARRAAKLYSLMRTCAQYGVPPLPYLTDVLRKLGSGWDNNRLDELLPNRWQAPTTLPEKPQGP
jgi:hypothetical protein